MAYSHAQLTAYLHKEGEVPHDLRLPHRGMEVE
jgi:hypothetical protein